MSTLDLGFVLEATGGQLVGGEGRAPVFSGVSTDTRTLREGELFVALRGPSFDANELVGAAAQAGALAAIVERPTAGLLLPQVVVPDTRAALGRLAHAHRRRLGVRVVGVTGSVGKTTTKELLYAVLAQSAPTLATEGNLNNDIGVPLTLLRLGAGHRFAVVEMGMSAPGEIAQLAAWAEPEVGVCTRVAPAHLSTLGSLDAIADAKAELYQAIPEEGAIVFPSFDERLAARAARARARRRLGFGYLPTDAVHIESIRTAGEGTMMNVRFGGGGTRCVGVPLLGHHNALNAAAAAAAAWALGLGADSIAQGLSYARPPKRRSESKTVAGRRVIDDCYNANPVSMAAALDTLAQVRRKARAVAVLGDMLELGPDEEAFHAEVGRHAARSGLSALVAFGPRSRALAAAAREAGLAEVRETDSPEQAAAWALELTGPGDWVLLKASRGTALERVLEEMQRQGKAS